MEKIKLQKIKLEQYGNYQFNSETKIGEKPIRIGFDRTRGEFVLRASRGIFLRLGVELTIIAIFDKTKKEIKKMEESTKSLYLNFDKIKLLNKK